MAEETTYKYYAFTADTLLAHDQELVKKTKEYVDANGGKINTIKVNGETQAIESGKVVNIKVPTKVSELTNDSNYATPEQVDGLIVNYGYQTITGGRDDISKHNTSATAHSDIRESVSNLNTKLGAFLDSDDETLDQLSELITAIKANQGSIASLTTGKVNTADVKVWTTAEVQSIVDSAWA